jgi:hypothetical protein
VRTTRIKKLAVGVFATGALALVAGVVVTLARDEGTGETGADPTPTATAMSTATATSTPRPSATPTATPAPTLTPTPTPFAGNVARLQLEAFGVDSVIELVGVDETNTMETPKDPHNTGWYYEPETPDRWDRPGWGGNAVFSAHVDYWPDIVGPFSRLAETKPGDRIHVVMEDGTRYVYEAVTNTQYDADTIPMGEIIDPPERPAGEEWVTLITCGGTFVRGPQGWGEYLHRDVVVAKLVETIPPAG